MAATLQFEERVLFSPHLAPEVNQLLQTGVANTRNAPERAEAALKQAQVIAPACLATYFALYKFYFHHLRLAEAEQQAEAALTEAAKQAGFAADYQQLKHCDMYVSEAALFYLYSLKALAFIKLRREQLATAQEILATLSVLDPEDRCGASVIRSLAEALTEA